MSSAAAATATSSPVAHTYWCHECDMSISLLSTSSPSLPVCPHCHYTDFLEQMDSSSASSVPQPTTDDNYLLDSPYLRRLIRHLAQSRSPSPPPSLAHSIPTVHITPLILSPDPILLCPICKDQFDVGSEAKQLPCKHFYHSDCIVPWLSHNNTCPLCRFQLPAQVRNSRKLEEDMVMMEDDLDGNLFGFENTLRIIARRRSRVLIPELRQQSSSSIDSDDVIEESGSQPVLSPTQVGEVGESQMVERETSEETVSSWPRWTVVEGGDHSPSWGGGGGDYSLR